MSTQRPNKPVLAGLMRGVQGGEVPAASIPTSPPAAVAPRQPPPATSLAAAGGNALAALVEAAQAQRAQVATPSRAVTVRLPENLLERVDRIVFETGMKKQDLFEHALRAAVDAVEATLPRRR